MPNNTQKQVRSVYQTPAFRLSYPNLFTAVQQLNQEMKFTATMLFPKSTTTAKLKAANHPAATWMPTDDLKGFWQEIMKIARANFGPDVNPATLKLTKFRDGDQPKTNNKVDENEHGYIVVRTTSKEKPKCLRQDKTLITDQSELYPGCWVRAILTVAPFTKPEHGVTIYLAGIQKLADDSAFSSRPRVEDAFDAVGADASAGAPGAGTVEKMPWE